MGDYKITLTIEGNSKDLSELFGKMAVLFAECTEKSNEPTTVNEDTNNAISKTSLNSETEVANNHFVKAMLESSNLHDWRDVCTAALVLVVENLRTNGCNPSELNLYSRALNALTHKCKIRKLGELYSLVESNSIWFTMQFKRNVGSKTKEYIKKLLELIGLHLGEEIDV